MNIDEAKGLKNKKKSDKEKMDCANEEMQAAIEQMQAEGMSEEEIEAVIYQIEEDAVAEIVEDLRTKGLSDEEIFEALEAEYLDLKHNVPIEESTGFALVQASINQSPIEVAKVFDQAIKERLSETIEEWKAQIAYDMFPSIYEDTEELEEGEAFNDATNPGPEVRPGAVQYQPQPEGNHLQPMGGPEHLPQSVDEQPDGAGNDMNLMGASGNPGPVHLPHTVYYEPRPEGNHYQPMGGPEHLPQSVNQQPHPGPFNLQPRIPGPQRLPQSRDEQPHQNQFNSPGPATPVRKDVSP